MWSGFRYKTLSVDMSVGRVAVMCPWGPVDGTLPSLCLSAPSCGGVLSFNTHCNQHPHLHTPVFCSSYFTQSHTVSLHTLQV